MDAIVTDGLNSNFMIQPSLHSSSSFALTGLFVLALLVVFGVQLWLSSRQIRHVAQFRSVVPPAFTKNISLSAHQKAADYTIVKMRFGLLELAVSSAVVLGWTVLGGLSFLDQKLVDLLGSGMGQQIALLVAFFSISSLMEIPFAIYRTFVIEDHFGFNKMSIKQWLIDLLKSSLISMLIGLPLVALLLWLMRETGQWWWLWTWGAWISFSLMLLLVYPTLIAPIFNKFKPLEDEELESHVTALMQRCDFSARGLFVMDGSTRSAHANAYFTGFGTAKRVVFYDTLLAKLSVNEVTAVLAHELGHYKHNHILKRIAFLFFNSFLGLALLGYLTSQVWFYTGLGSQPRMDSSNEAIAVLLFLLVIPTFSFFITPLTTSISRKHEFEADEYALRQTCGGDLASALLKMYEDNASTLTPDPVYARFHYSHPPASERLARLSFKPSIRTHS